MRQPLVVLIALAALFARSECGYTAVARQRPAALHRRASSISYHATQLRVGVRAAVMMDKSAVADVPTSDAADSTNPQPRGRGGGGGRGGRGGRGRGGGSRGESMVLLNPMYLKRRAPVYPQGGQQRDNNRGDGGGASRSAPSRDAGSFSPRPTSGVDSEDDSPGFSPGPTDRGGAGRARSFGADKKKAPGASAWEKPKRGEGAGGGKGGKERRGKGRNFEADDGLAAGTLARAPRKKGKASKRVVQPVEPVGPAKVTLSDAITVGELATQLRVGAAEVVKDLMKMGVLASITQSIDADTAEKVALGFGAEVTRGEGEGSAEGSLGALGVLEEEEDADQLVKRPPVVTIMGHVDHGKTSLLDAMRMASVADGEAGGITQHIGAYSVRPPGDEGSPITFIDTPGHAAFDEMRARGANVTDLVILAVAADDGVRPQTVQSIKAARAASVPIIVALTKSDKPEADAAKVKLELLEQEVVLEEFGGEVLSAVVSSKTKEGLDQLFESISMQADLLDLKANPDRLASGTVLEARQVQGKGAVATVLVQRGTLKQGDIVVAGAQWGRVRSLVDDEGGRIESAGPSAAVELIGLSGLPEAGDQLTVTADDTKARELAETRQRLQRERRSSALFATRSSAEQSLFLSGLQGDLPTKLLDFVIKADVQGSAEALQTSVTELEAADDKLQVKTRVLRSGAGAVTNEDIMLASVSNAMVLAFNSPVNKQQLDEASKQGVVIKEYNVVYDALDDVRAMMAALIRPPPSKQLGDLVGTLDVQQIFKIGAVGKVAGCKVLDGFIRVGCNIRILRGNLIVYEGKLQSLRSFKDLVDQVDAPNECGMSFDDFQDMQPEDRVEAYAARESSGDDVGYGGSKGQAE